MTTIGGSRRSRWIWQHNSNQAKDTAFDQSKSEKKHAWKVIEYEKFLGVEESLQSLILQAVDEPFVEALKEEYIEYDRWTPNEILVHLQIKISKVTNRDKLQQKREVFIAWEQPQVLLAYFKQIEKAKKQLTKWNVTTLDNIIIIYAVNQMYEYDWFSKETMTKWEENNDNTQKMEKLSEVLWRGIHHPQMI